MIQEVDILLWRMIFLAMVSNYIKEARKPCWLHLGTASITQRLQARSCLVLGHQRVGFFEEGVWLGRNYVCARSIWWLRYQTNYLWRKLEAGG